MGSQPSKDMCRAAADRRLRIIRERLFPPTWVEALRALQKANPDPAGCVPAPADLMHELLIPTPHGSHGDNPEEDFRTWFHYRHEFGKLLCLYNAMSRVATALNLADPSEPDFAAWFDVAARILDSAGDRDIAIVCLDVASKQ
jgi:hypothetical protein